MSFWDSVSSGLKVASQKAGVMLENVAQFVAPPETSADTSGFGNLGRTTGTGNTAGMGGAPYGGTPANPARDVSLSIIGPQGTFLRQRDSSFGLATCINSAVVVPILC